jgi:hypothetical protein
MVLISHQDRSHWVQSILCPSSLAHTLTLTQGCHRTGSPYLYLLNTSTMPTTPDWRSRYTTAYRAYQDETAPSMVKDHGYIATTFLKTATANGLTQAICKFLLWSGHRATRINVTGFLEKGAETQPSGTVLTVNKWRKSSTRKGTADISATIRGRAVMIEIKVGRDRPSEAQLKEQALERKAGGVYEFIHTIEEFFTWYDGFIHSTGTLF